MTVKLTSNFFANARGITLLDGGGVTWSINANTNEISASAGGGGPSPGNPTASVGLTAVNGSASTYMRSDGAPPIDQTIAPTWTSKHTFTPSTGVAGIIVNGAQNVFAAQIIGAAVAGTSFGLTIQAGTGSSDTALLVEAHNAAPLLQVWGDGSATMGSPTGGQKGANTLNSAGGLFVNGVAVSTAVGANPSASVGLSAVNGSAATFMRSDGAPALSQAISPTWTGNHTFQPASGNGLVAIAADSSSSTLSVNIANHAQSDAFLQIFNDGHGHLGVSGSVGVSWNTSGSMTFSGRIGWNGATPPAQVTGFGTPVGGAVVASYNITDAGGANSNTNKCVAEILTILKAHGMIGA